MSPPSQGALPEMTPPFPDYTSLLQPLLRKPEPPSHHVAFRPCLEVEQQLGIVRAQREGQAGPQLQLRFWPAQGTISDESSTIQKTGSIFRKRIIRESERVYPTLRRPERNQETEHGSLQKDGTI